MKFKALSLKQPWANLVVRGQKTIEVRNWTTNYRGDIVICSSQRPDKKFIYPDLSREPMGYAIGIVELHDIIEMNILHEHSAMCKKNDGDQAWILKNPHRFKTPYPIKGKLSIFDIEIPDYLTELK